MSVQAQSRLTAMTRRLATLQAHVTRLDALGSHLTELAGLETEEFDFSAPLALGGPLFPCRESRYRVWMRSSHSLVLWMPCLPAERRSSMFSQVCCRLSSSAPSRHQRGGLFGLDGNPRLTGTA